MSIEINKLVEGDVSRTHMIMSLGDFIESSLPGANDVLDKLVSYLKIGGHTSVHFKDTYAALQVLDDKSLSALSDLAASKGMPQVA